MNDHITKKGGKKDFFFFFPFCNRIKIVDKLLNGRGFFTIFNISDFFFFFDSVCKLKVCHCFFKKQ